MADAGSQGLAVRIAGAAVVGIQRDVRIERKLGVVGSCSFSIQGRLADITIPAHGDAVEVEDVQEGRILFGGTVYLPAPTVYPGGGYAKVAVRCVGHEAELQRLIGLEDGARIAGLDTIGEQFEELVALLGAGFTADTAVAGDRAAGDLRLRTIGSVFEELQQLTDGVITVSPEKAVTLEAFDDLPDAGLDIDLSVAKLGLKADPKDLRSRQYVTSGQIARSASFVGDGARRLFPLAAAEQVTDIEIALPAPSLAGLLGGRHRVSWSISSGVSYGDVSGLSDPPGNSALIRALQLGQGLNSYTDAQLRRAIEMFLGTTTTEDALNREDLSPAWETSPRALIFEAPGLDPLVLPGPSATGVERSDTAEPYRWALSATQNAAAYPGGIEQWNEDVGDLEDAEQAQIVLKLSDGRTLTASALLSVSAITRATVNDVEVEVGTDAAVWTFDKARQALIQADSETPLSSSDVLRVGIDAQRVTLLERAATRRIDRLDGLDGGATAAEAERFATALLDRHATPSERLRGDIRSLAKRHVDIGMTSTVDVDLATALRVAAPIAAGDKWVYAEVTIEQEGDRGHYSFALIRRRFESPFAEFWRRLLSR